TKAITMSSPMLNPKSNIGFSSSSPDIGGEAGYGRQPTTLSLAVSFVVSAMSLPMTFGSAVALSSSERPFLKLLMPLATSPIRSEILPRPNSRTTINITMAQCQIEKEPINHSLDSLWRASLAGLGALLQNDL